MKSLRGILSNDSGFEKIKRKSHQTDGNLRRWKSFVEFGEVEITEEDSKSDFRKENIWEFFTQWIVGWAQKLPNITPEWLQNNVHCQKKHNNLHGWI
jgi:hypothetical protein